MPHLLVSPCGRTKSKNGKFFTAKTLAQHKRDCPTCRGSKELTDDDDELDLDPLGVIGDDESDGVYWAMHTEFYGWP